VFLRQFLQQRDQLLVLDLLEGFRKRLLRGVGSLGEDVAQFLRAEGLLGVEEDGLDDGFEFHVSSSGG